SAPRGDMTASFRIDCDVGASNRMDVTKSEPSGRNSGRAETSTVNWNGTGLVRVNPDPNEGSSVPSGRSRDTPTPPGTTRARSIVPSPRKRSLDTRLGDQSKPNAWSTTPPVP